MMYPLVRDLAADGIPVAVTCRVLGFTTQAFYAWKKSPVSQRDWDNAHLLNAAIDIHADDPGFGYRFIADELPARGISAGENRVADVADRSRREPKRCCGPDADAMPALQLSLLWWVEHELITCPGQGVDEVVVTT